MKKFKPVNTGQYFLLPPSVQDFIGEDHLARVVNEVVDSLDTEEIEKGYSHLGQKSYHPKLLLKVLFYGYTIGVRSGRKIAERCENDVAFMYLAGMYKPDFRTINDFRKNNVERVKQFFVEVIQICQGLGMVNIGNLVIDSTKLRANASSRRTKSREQYEQWLTDVERQVGDMLQEVADNDKQEDERFGDNRGDELPPAINTKQKLKTKLREVIEQLKEGEKQNLTDPDARIIRSGGRLQTNYSCQAAVTTNGIIVNAYAADSAHDAKHLAEIIRGAEEYTHQQAETILADSGYASYENYEQLTRLHKRILIPDQEKTTESQKVSVNPFHRNHFQYDAVNDRFICPEGKSLNYVENYKNRGQQSKVYKGMQCGDCSKRVLCTKGNARQIHLENRTHLRTQIRQLLDSPAGKKLYKLRQQVIEPIFGNIKHNLNYTMLQLRTLKKVNAEWQMICLTQNIRKIWQIKCEQSQ